MERNFLGLKWNDSKTDRKRTKETCTDSVATPQWSYSKKVSLPDHFMPYAASQEDKQMKNVHFPLTSPAAFLPVSNSYAFDLNSKLPPSSPKQKNMMWNIPFEDRTISVGTSSPLPNSCNAMITSSTCGLNKVAAPMRNQLLGAEEKPSISLRSSFVKGTADLRNKAEPPAHQLAIFYANALYIYDDISPEKAGAILSLAKLGSSSTPNANPTSKPISEDTTSNLLAQPSQNVNLQQHFSAAYIKGTVPRARKATLQRFLEKRKDRLAKRL